MVKKSSRKISNLGRKALAFATAVLTSAELCNISATVIPYHVVPAIERGLYDIGVFTLENGNTAFNFPSGSQNKFQLDISPTSTESTTPTLTPTPIPTDTPTPTSTSISDFPPNPYFHLINRYWPDIDPTKVSNIMYLESGYRPNVVHVNSCEGRSFSKIINSPEELESLIRRCRSVDIGLMQINSNEPIYRYLISKGLDWYDLLNPAINIYVARELYEGRIPGTNSGFDNWVAAQILGYD